MHSGSRPKILEYLTGRIKSGGNFQIVTFNALMLNHAFTYPEFFKVLESGECVNDSIGITLACLLKTGKYVERFQGVELFYDLLEFAAGRGLPVFIYGASEDSNRKACENINRKYPGIKICGRLNGYTDGAEEIIKKAQPRLLFAALDSPAQEGWLYERRDEFGCVSMGIGGTLDVVSGNLRRAPRFLQACGLEWLGRLLREPRRITRITRLPVFLFRVLIRLL